MRKNTNNPKNENICGNIKKVNTQLIPQFLIFFHLALNITSPPKREIISQPRSHEEREKKSLFVEGNFEERLGGRRE